MNIAFTKLVRSHPSLLLFTKNSEVELWQNNVQHSLHVGWRNFFSSCAVMSVFGSGRKQVLVLFPKYLCTQSTIQLWCCVSFLVLAGNSFWCFVRTQCIIQLCSCVSFLVVAGNCSQNENMFLPKNLIELLFMICQPMCVFHKT